MPTPPGSFKERLYRQWHERQYQKLSLRKSTISISGVESLAYFDTGAPRDGGSRRPILLIHGLTGGKDAWLAMIGLLSKGHRVVALDLAGHGESSEASNDDYGLESQARRATLLTAELDLGRHHVLGHSMGGAIAIAYALTSADWVRSLGLVAPAGLPHPHTSQFMRLLEQGINPLIVTDSWSGGQRLRYLTNGPLRLRLLSYAIDSVLTSEALGRARLHRRIFAQLDQDSSLDGRLPGIHQPTLVLWGTEDRVLDPTRVDEYRSQIHGARVEWLGGHGHTPIIEAPNETSHRYLRFLESLPRSRAAAA